MAIPGADNQNSPLLRGQSTELGDTSYPLLPMSSKDQVRPSAFHHPLPQIVTPSVRISQGTELFTEEARILYEERTGQRVSTTTDVLYAKSNRASSRRVPREVKYFCAMLVDVLDPSQVAIISATTLKIDISRADLSLFDQSGQKLEGQVLYAHFINQDNLDLWHLSSDIEGKQLLKLHDWRESYVYREDIAHYFEVHQAISEVAKSVGVSPVLQTVTGITGQKEYLTLIPVWEKGGYIEEAWIGIERTLEGDLTMRTYSPALNENGEVMWRAGGFNFANIDELKQAVSISPRVYTPLTKSDFVFTDEELAVCLRQFSDDNNVKVVGIKFGGEQVGLVIDLRGSKNNVIVNNGAGSARVAQLLIVKEKGNLRVEACVTDLGGAYSLLACRDYRFRSINTVLRLNGLSGWLQHYSAPAASPAPSPLPESKPDVSSAEEAKKVEPERIAEAPATSSDSLINEAPQVTAYIQKVSQTLARFKPEDLRSDDLTTVKPALELYDQLVLLKENPYFKYLSPSTGSNLETVINDNSDAAISAQGIIKISEQKTREQANQADLQKYQADIQKALRYFTPEKLIDMDDIQGMQQELSNYKNLQALSQDVHFEQLPLELKKQVSQTLADSKKAAQTAPTRIEQAKRKMILNDYQYKINKAFEQFRGEDLLSDDYATAKKALATYEQLEQLKDNPLYAQLDTVLKKQVVSQLNIFRDDAMRIKINPPPMLPTTAYEGINAKPSVEGSTYHDGENLSFKIQIKGVLVIADFECLKGILTGYKIKQPTPSYVSYEAAFSSAFGDLYKVTAFDPKPGKEERFQLTYFINSSFQINDIFGNSIPSFLFSPDKSTGISVKIDFNFMRSDRNNPDLITNWEVKISSQDISQPQGGSPRYQFNDVDIRFSKYDCVWSGHLVHNKLGQYFKNTYEVKVNLEGTFDGQYIGAASPVLASVFARDKEQILGHEKRHTLNAFSRVQDILWQINEHITQNSK